MFSLILLIVWFMLFLGCEEHAVRGSEVFVGGLSRSTAEDKILEVCHLLADCSFISFHVKLLDGFSLVLRAL